MSVRTPAPTHPASMVRDFSAFAMRAVAAGAIAAAFLAALTLMLARHAQAIPPLAPTTATLSELYVADAGSYRRASLLASEAQVTRRDGQVIVTALRTFKPMPGSTPAYVTAPIPAQAKLLEVDIESGAQSVTHREARNDAGIELAPRAATTSEAAVTHRMHSYALPMCEGEAKVRVRVVYALPDRVQIAAR
jgi:hypothetical protein